MSAKLSSRIMPALSAVFPWLITGIAIVGVIVIITPRSAVIEISDEAWLNSSADGVSGQPHLPVEPPAQDSGSEDFGGNPAQDAEPAPSPVDPVPALNIDPSADSTVSDANSSTATERASAAPQQPGTTSGDLFPAESLPPPAGGPDKASASNIQETEGSSKSAATADAATAAIKQPDSISAEIQPEETTRASSPWVINLASSRSKDNAERFKERAESRGIAAVLYRATVKGNEYWRVQVSGFATAAEAKSEASLIREKLGIDDIWIVKQ